MKKITLTATLPDGNIIKRHTHRDYLWVSVVYSDGSWGFLAWHTQRSLAEGKMQWARNLCFNGKPVYEKATIVPVNKSTTAAPAPTNRSVHTEVRSINGMDFQITIYDGQSNLPLGNRMHAFVWNEYAQERYQAFAERTEATDEYEGHTWTACENTVEEALEHIVAHVDNTTKTEEVGGLDAIEPTVSTNELPETTVTIRPGALFAKGSAIPFWYCSPEKVLECDIITRVDANTYKLYVKNSDHAFEVDADQILWIEYEPHTSDAGVMYDQPALPINPIGDDVVRVEWRGVTASPNYKFFHKDGSTHRVWETFQTQDLLEEIDFWLNEASWHFDGWEKNTMIWTRVQSDDPRTLNTADLRTQHEYAQWVCEEPAAPATKFQMKQAVNTRFWGKYVGRVVSISPVEDGITYYEVQLKSGRIVIEPEIYLSPAPQYEATLPKCKPRRALTMREIEARLDTPDHGNDDRARNYCWYGGVDLFAE